MRIDHKEFLNHVQAAEQAIPAPRSTLGMGAGAIFILLLGVIMIPYLAMLTGYVAISGLSHAAKRSFGLVADTLDYAGKVSVGK
jgi:hypothetical protein